MLGKSLNILAKFLVVIFSLLIVYVVAVVIINLRDKPPSATVVEFEQAWNNRAAVADNDNGYLFLLGFDVAETEDPKAIGLERVEWSQQVISSSSEENLEFPQASYFVQENLPAEFAELVNLCSEVTQDCINAIEKNKTLIDEWQNNQPWVNDRYRQLIAHSGWLELSALDIRLPLPKYAEVLKAQRIIFISAFANITPNDNGYLSKLLDRDLRFWRGVLKDSDTLIGKMIASVAIKNNFLWTNYFLLHDGKMPLDASMHQPFTDDELSMYRCLIGEWKFGNAAYQAQFDQEHTRASGKLLINLAHKKQDTVNQLATRVKSALDNLDVPVNEFEVAFTEYTQQLRQESVPKNKVHYLFNPYNPVGQILVGIASPDYGNYAARSKNLEAFRRGLLFSVEQMNNSSPTATRLLSPYPSKPFAIDQQQRSVTVNGLGNNSAHRQQVYFY